MAHHRRGLRQLLKNDELLAAIEMSWEDSGLVEKRLSMLRYAVKLTNAPGDMVEADVTDLRSVGFSDRDILDIAEVVAYYAYVNRIADGLGVPLETWIVEYQTL